jgi:hypothetical protein
MSPVCRYPTIYGCFGFTGSAETADTVEAMRKPWVYKRRSINGW